MVDSQIPSAVASSLMSGRIRANIAAIIAIEAATQRAFAESQGSDPRVWEWRVYTERDFVLELWLNDENGHLETPVVNVWFESAAYDKSRSTAVRPVYTGRFIVDCYGPGLAQDDGSGGHIPEDVRAAEIRDRVAGLAYTALMTHQNSQVQLNDTGAVWNSMTVGQMDNFVPTVGDRPARFVRASRLVVEVAYAEPPPQREYGTLESIRVDVQHDPLTNEVTASAEFEYPE